MLGAGAEPATTIRFREPAPRPAASKCGSSLAYRTGTPPVTVTDSASISSAMLAASIFGPGNTSLAPTIGAACVNPQAPFAWNIGVIGRIVSSGVKAPDEAPAIERQCSTS